MKKYYFQSRILYPAKLLVKCEGRIKIFSKIKVSKTHLSYTLPKSYQRIFTSTKRRGSLGVDTGHVMQESGRGNLSIMMKGDLRMIVVPGVEVNSPYWSSVTYMYEGCPFFYHYIVFLIRRSYWMLCSNKIRV